MRLHPLSVPYRTLSRGASAALSLFFVGSALSGSGVVPRPLGGLVVPLLVAVGVLATALWQVAYYRRFDYELTADGLEIASGVVSRRQREIPLRRVQNVDISRDVVQRLLGIAALDLETAGGSATEASLRYIGYEEAKRLQREIQRRKREGTSGEASGERTADAEAERDASAEAREELLFELAAGELALLSVLSFDLRYFSLLAFGPATLQFVPGLSDLAVVGGLTLYVVLGVGLWVVSAALTFARYYGFRLTRVDDELRYERGLFQRFDGSIPLAKVQTVTTTENVLMRRFGYATLAVETAGYGPGQSPSGGSEAAVPLASRERVESLAREVEPFASPTFERPPKRARTRYALRYLLGLGVLVAVLYAVWLFFGRPTVWYAPLAPLAFGPLLPLAAHLTWVNRGYDAGADHVVTRNGFWNRTTKVVPYYRVQTVVQTRTIFQRRRRWRLADVVVDTASSASFGGGVALAADLDAADAAELREFVARKLQESLSARRAPEETGR